MRNRARTIGCVCLLLLGLPTTGWAQSKSTGTLRGVVTIGDQLTPVPHARVSILKLRRSVVSDESGNYAFEGVPAGTYEISAHLERVADSGAVVAVAAGETTTADINLFTSGINEHITVTATGEEQLTSSSIQSVSIVGSEELTKRSPVSLGEALDKELGVSKRSYGPGSARPVVRGFDGDRVLILQDGMRIGALGFQSGDHAEPIDVLGLERIEIVKGPSTLLYGSNAIGGVVNAVQGHETAQPGFRGFFTTVGGSNLDQLSGNGGLEYGTDRWLVWGQAGGSRTGDYETPIGTILNSYSQEGSASAGTGYFHDKGFFNVTYTFDKRRYGIPYERTEEAPEIVYLDPRRHSIKISGGFRDLASFVQGGNLSFQYNNYRHGERNSFTDEINTAFKNTSYAYRGLFNMRRQGHFSGSFGFEGGHRDYVSSGEEAIAPPTTGTYFAVFGLEVLDFERATIQFGGRLEHNEYTPEVPLDNAFGIRDRSFTGFSGALGLRVPMWEGGSFVTNYSHSYRAPGLEELYNNGPHPGNNLVEVGNPNLERELSNGFDLGFRQSSGRVSGEVNFYYYRLSDYVFLAPTGVFDEEEGLEIANYLQTDSRYTGLEARLNADLYRGLAFEGGLDYVDAEITDTGTPLPRIPPLRGRLGLSYAYDGFRINPEVVVADKQDRVFPNETSTAGYATFGLHASYTIAGAHRAHVFSVDGFNLGDRLYRNHLSFIKDFAPEIGRGVRASYTVKFY